MKFNKKTLKWLLIIITIIMFVISIYEIVKTYALFESQADGQVELSIAKWNIKINNNDITNGLTEEIVINEFSVIQNPNVKEGKIAPGMQGMVDLRLDPTDTDVSVKYQITLGDIGDQPISLDSVELISGESELIQTDENEYTGVILLDDINEARNSVIDVRISVIWENDETRNEEDTLIGTTTGMTLDIPIEVTVTQYLGEEIEEYDGQGA